MDIHIVPEWTVTSLSARRGQSTLIHSLDSFPFERTGNESQHALALTFGGSDPICTLEPGNETSRA